MDAAGVIDEVGPDVEDWQVGDQVMAMALPLSEHGGAYVEYLVAPIGSFTAIPAGLSIEEAATVPMNGLTALQILARADLAEGDTLAVTGAAGLLGNYVVQLAKQRGITVIADAAPKDEDLVRSLGPDHMCAGATGSQRPWGIVHGGVDALADAAVQRDEVVDAVRDGGFFADVRGWEGNGARGIRFERIMVFSEYTSFDLLEELRQAVEDGVLTPRVAEVLPATRAAEAHERLAAGGTRGAVRAHLVSAGRGRDHLSDGRTVPAGTAPPVVVGSSVHGRLRSARRPTMAAQRSSSSSTRSATAAGSSCSHDRTTRQPSAVRIAWFRASRCRFASSFRRHSSAFAFGSCTCSSQRCQKQPSTNTATRARGKTRSGRTRHRRLTCRSTKNRRPRWWSSRRTASSGAVSR